MLALSTSGTAVCIQHHPIIHKHSEAIPILTLSASCTICLYSEPSHKSKTFTIHLDASIVAIWQLFASGTVLRIQHHYSVCVVIQSIPSLESGNLPINCQHSKSISKFALSACAAFVCIRHGFLHRHAFDP